MGIRVKGIREVDGATVEVDLSGQEGGGSGGGGGQSIPLLSYDYNSGPQPPDAGQIRTDDGDPEVLTELWVHRFAKPYSDLKFFLLSMKAGDKIYLQAQTSADNRALYVLDEDAIDEGTFVTLKVHPEFVSGTPLYASGMLVTLFA